MNQKPGAGAAKREPHQHAYAGDEIFFHKGGQPVAGKVICAGQHGCTVDHGGQRHKVRWEHVAGHKKRGLNNYKVVDHGEDGLIVADSTGRRQYVGIPPEARGERLVLDDGKGKAKK